MHFIKTEEINMKKENFLNKFEEEFLRVNAEHSPSLKIVEGCGDYLGILLNGNDIGEVNKKAKWIKEGSSLLVGWETDYYTTLPKEIDLEYFNFIRIGKKTYEVQISREIDENNNPVYGVVEI